MDDKEIQQPRNKKFQDGGRPAFYMALLSGLYKLADSMGYNLMVHGSLCRDFDLCAVAWVHGAKPAEELIKAMAEHCGGQVVDSVACDPYDFTLRGAEPKPHGRYAWTIHLSSDGPHGPRLDVSVIGPEPDSVLNSFRRMDDSLARFNQAKAQEAIKAGITNLKDLVARALQEPTLMHALAFASVWDTERAVDQAKRNEFKSWETTSLYLFTEVKKAWEEAHPT